MKEIIKPGLYNIPMGDYLADPCPDPSVSAGLCKTILEKSVLHASLEHPRTGKRSTSTKKELKIGTVAHELLLHGSGGYEVSQEWDNYKTKASREWRDSVTAEGKTPMLAHEFELVKKMSDPAKSALDDICRGNGWTAESTLIWRYDGVWCRARPDVLFDSRKVVIDYKTCVSAAPAAFQKDALKQRYTITAAHYSQGVRALFELDHYPRYIFLAQEKSPPYACSAHEFECIDNSLKDRDFAVSVWRDFLHADSRDTGKSYSVTTPYLMKECW